MKIFKVIEILRWKITYAVKLLDHNIMEILKLMEILNHVILYAMEILNHGNDNA